MKKDFIKIKETYSYRYHTLARRITPIFFLVSGVAPDSLIVFIGISTKVVFANLSVLVFVRRLFRPPLTVLYRDRLCYFFPLVMFTNIIAPVPTI